MDEHRPSAPRARLWRFLPVIVILVLVALPLTFRMQGLARSVTGLGGLGDGWDGDVLSYYADWDSFIPSTGPVADLDTKFPDRIRAYWERHRDEPGAERYYTYWVASNGSSDSGRRLEDGDYTLGAELEPDNALFDLLRAGQQASWTAFESGENQVEGENGLLRADIVHDRARLELAIGSIRSAAGKAYCRTYAIPFARTRVAALPRARYTEDYLRIVYVEADTLFPSFGRIRWTLRSLPGAVRVLIAEGKRAEAEELLDTWLPLARLFLTDPDPTQRDVGIGDAVAKHFTGILSEAAAALYPKLGRPRKAAQARAVLTRINEITEERDSARRTGDGSAYPFIPAYLFSLLPNTKHFDQSAYDFRPARMHEHVLYTRGALVVLYILVALLVLEALLRAAIAGALARRTGERPPDALPDARVLARAVGWGVVLPAALYAALMFIPVIGGREHGWATMWPRFGAELVTVAAAVLVVPALVVRRAVLARCASLGVPLPSRAALAGWVVAHLAAAVAPVALAAYYVTQSVEIAPGWAAAITAGTAVGPWLVLDALLLRQPGARPVFGALARGMALVYAAVAVVLALFMPPLLAAEAHYLAQDHVGLGYLVHTPSDSAVWTRVSEDQLRELRAQLREALDAANEVTGPPYPGDGEEPPKFLIYYYM